MDVSAQCVPVVSRALTNGVLQSKALPSSRDGARVALSPAVWIYWTVLRSLTKLAANLVCVRGGALPGPVGWLQWKVLSEHMISPIGLTEDQ
jgi:hypothetical protein